VSDTLSSNYLAKYRLYCSKLGFVVDINKAGMGQLDHTGRGSSRE